MGSAYCQTARRSTSTKSSRCTGSELDYKLEHGADALLEKMANISFVANPIRQKANTEDTLTYEDFDGEMDDACYHIESIEEKKLPVDPITAYNHMAIYLRWCMEHDLMSEEFIEEYGEVVQQVKADPAGVDLREFIRDELDSCLFAVLFNHQGHAFASYYYGESDDPYYPADIDNYALEYFGSEQYHLTNSRMKPTSSSLLMRTIIKLWQRLSQNDLTTGKSRHNQGESKHPAPIL